MAFTLVYNVDNKATRSNGNCLFNSDADFVICDNSANTHICKDREMFVTFKETTSGMVATCPKHLGDIGRVCRIQSKFNDIGLDNCD